MRTVSYGVRGKSLLPYFHEILGLAKKLEDTQHLEKVLKEYEVLEPFEAFLNVSCEICQKPIKEWNGYNVKLTIQGTGCGHTQCWNSQVGQWRQIGKAIRKFKKDTK